MKVLGVVLDCRLDYCNAVLYGAPVGSVQKLQRVQNTAARIVLQTPKRSSVLLMLEQLHWLPVRQRTEYKLAILTYKIRSTSVLQPSHRTTHICLSPLFFHHTLPRSTSRPPQCALLTALSDVLHPLSGTL